jgi:TPR repeat protein
MIRIVCAALLVVCSIPAFAQTSSPNTRPADLAYGAYERGFYVTAFNEASARAKQNDPAAMTLLGELYAQGLGISKDDAKAVEWYRAAVKTGDANAMFSLAMFAFQGRGGMARNEAVRLLEQAAQRGHAVASYDLALLYMQSQEVEQDFKRAAALLQAASEKGNPEAQYALAGMYKEGRGVPKDLEKSALLLAKASIAGNLDAMVEFGIAQFNGTGTPKDEAQGAQLLLKAAQRGSPIAQNRVAHILSVGRGLPANPAQAIKWHLIAKQAGAGDPDLDAYAAKQSASVRDAAQKAADKWMSTTVALRP